MKKFNISTYQGSEDDVISWYVQSDSDFTEEEAWDALPSDIVEKVEFIEFDESVASYCGYKYSATFHEISEE